MTKKHRTILLAILGVLGVFVIAVWAPDCQVARRERVDG